MRSPVRRTSSTLSLLAAFFAVAVGPASADADTARDAILDGKSTYSYTKEELIVRHFFNDKRDGFYLDVGAYHWFVGSTTAYLEIKLGWKGIAIDAQPGLAGSWSHHRPNAKFFQYAVSDKSGSEISFFVAGPLSSTNEARIKRFPGKKKFKPKKVTVQTITLNDLLDREGVKRIDFMSMDIEGAEPEALAGFDIERFRPELIGIEAGPGKQPFLLTYFGEHGYERIDRYMRYDPYNWYFKPTPTESKPIPKD